MKILTILTTALLTSTALWAQTPVVDGEITRIDAPQAKVTLRHGEIRNLDMPPMTMVFRVADAKLLKGLSVGDKVRFSAEKIDGNYTVTTLSKAPARTP